MPALSKTALRAEKAIRIVTATISPRGSDVPMGHALPSLVAEALAVIAAIVLT